MYVVLCLFLVVSTSAIDCLERLVSDMTYYVSSGTLNPTHSLTHSELGLTSTTWPQMLFKAHCLAVLCLFHTADTDKTKLSCLLFSVSAVWSELLTSQDSFVLSQNAVWTELCLCLDPVSNLQLFSLKYIDDYCELYWLVASSVHTADADKSRLVCRFLLLQMATAAGRSAATWCVW